VHGIERILHGDHLFAIVVRRNASSEKKYNFLTDADNSLQLGINSYRAGEVIPTHSHFRTEVSVQSGQEFILVNGGKLRVKLYDPASRDLLSTHDLDTGDMILLVFGAHGFEALEPCQIVEVKQGPYLSKEKDKVVWDA
jgi:hypothetical protein